MLVCYAIFQHLNLHSNYCLCLSRSVSLTQSDRQRKSREITCTYLPLPTAMYHTVGKLHGSVSNFPTIWAFKIQLEARHFPIGVQDRMTFHERANERDKNKSHLLD